MNKELAIRKAMDYASSQNISYEKVGDVKLIENCWTVELLFKQDEEFIDSVTSIHIDIEIETGVINAISGL